MKQASLNSLPHADPVASVILVIFRSQNLREGDLTDGGEFLLSLASSECGKLLPSFLLDSAGLLHHSKSQFRH